ncbi:glycosyltransferase family 2 protein [Halomonas sp. M20]|uniref:glycosyltransferase family 2 protein n=1 Tax=Halomonas sp. M20 TaxID=2763264 RepID=UPI001D0A8BC4|nr:glycosyltransferase family 2 protein [Halomonas sp. M20]
MPQPLLSILIPAKDEAGNLFQLLDEIAAALPDEEYEILVVDDGSTDATWTLLSQRAAQNARLRPLRHTRSAGQSTSIWQAAWAARGTWLATLDGDGQNDPADLPRLYGKARQEGIALVNGHRVQRQDNRLTRLSSRVANRVRSALLKDNTPDTGCGLKIMRRDVFLRLPYFDHMHRFIPALIQAQGGQCVSVPVNHRPRGTGASHYGLNNRLWVGLVDIVGVMWLQRRTRLPAPLENSALPISEQNIAGTPTSAAPPSEETP